MSWDRLLEWMTHIGSGSWEGFRQAVDELGDPPEEERHRLYRTLRVALSDLGHADFFIGGSRRWGVRRPALIATASGDDEFILSGGRGSGLVEEICVAAQDLGVLATVGEDDPGLSRVRLRGEGNAIQELARRLELDHLPHALGALVAALPDLREAATGADSVPAPRNWDVRSWSFRDARWVDGRLHRTVREYANRYGVRRYLLKREPRAPLVEVEKRAGMYCAALFANAPIVQYSRHEQSLRVPLWAPLPADYSRVACLAGGRPAVVEDGHIVFKRIDQRVAAPLLAMLGQGQSMLAALS